MNNDETLNQMIKAIKEVYRIKNERLGLAPDQALLKPFTIKNEAFGHKKMKEIAAKEFNRLGFKKEQILIEKRIKHHKFRPDVIVIRKRRPIFVECHYHDGWNSSSKHIYKNIEAVKSLGRIIICAEYDKSLKIGRIMQKADEIWLMDLKEEKVKRKIRSTSS